MRKPFRIAAGVGLILIGIVGLILPVMPGWVFIIPGLAILGEYYPPAQRLVDWAKTKVESAVHRKSSGESRPVEPDADRTGRSVDAR